MSERTRADLLAYWERLLAEHRVALQEASQERNAARHESRALLARAEQAEAENAHLRARVGRLEVALRDAALAFENATKYNHREWHLEHEDVEPEECPDCQSRVSALAEWRGALAPEERPNKDHESITPHNVAHLALTRKTDAP